MKIGIMGGTFDPIHNGHLMLGEHAYKTYHLDQVWFVPNGNPPHKLAKTIQSDLTDRMEMVSLAIAKQPYFKLSSCEAKRDGISYSYETMERLSLLYPDDEFYFIMGADSLYAIESWKNFERLLTVCTILAACRDGVKAEEMMERIDYLNAEYQADVRLLTAPLQDISSHEIRERVKSKQSIEGIVPQAVREYIEDLSLYEERRR